MNLDKRIKYLSINKERIIRNCVRNYFMNMFPIFYTEEQIYKMFEKIINKKIQYLKWKELEAMILDTTPQ